MKSLFAKLSFALLLVVTLLGSGFFLIERYSTQNYYEEITQRLNSSIAMYVTGERQLMEDFVVNREALSLLAQQAMVINPTVEVFLLDTEGNILAHAFPPESIVQNKVDLSPVKALIGGNVEMPLRGTDPRNLDREKIFSAFPVMHNDVLQGYLYAVLGGDPRNLDREKIFSAFPVMHNDVLQGYLYAVLGGAKYDELANAIRHSYVQRLSVGALLAIVLPSTMNWPMPSVIVMSSVLAWGHCWPSSSVHSLSVCWFSGCSHAGSVCSPPMSKLLLTRVSVKTPLIRYPAFPPPEGTFKRSRPTTKLMKSASWNTRLAPWRTSCMNNLNPSKRPINFVANW